MNNYTPEEENKTKETATIKTFHYCDQLGRAVHKTKELFKNENKYIFYPYSVNTKDGSVSPKKIKTIEVLGWDNISDIPKDIKTTGKYGFGTLRMRQFLRILYPKFKELEKLVIGLNHINRFSKKTIILNWANLEPILKKIGNEKRWYDGTRKLMINNELASLTTKITKKDVELNAGQLNSFIDKFDSFEKISKSDVEALSKVFETAPPNKISLTSNFIKTKDKINRVFIEDIIKKFEKLMSSKTDNEKAWQNYFANNSWILNHLFPFEVILKKNEAYVGGKTIENQDGRVVDFLFQNGFEDNFALLEIKTHKKTFFKSNPYRKPDVFALSDELSGGISQCLDQKDTFIKEFGAKEKILDPKVILVIGNKGDLDEHKAKCFELLRANQKNVEIVTFDELLSKLRGLLNVISE